MEMMHHENHHHHHNHLGTSPKIVASSASSSPSHEFSFTISLNPNSTYYPKEPSTKSLSSSFLDLSPADDIFFHGQLLPLHHLSQLPSSISPRSSTTSLEIIDDDFFHEEKTPYQNQNQNQNHNQNQNQTRQNKFFEHDQETTPRANMKHKSFHFFGLRKWRKGWEETKEETQHGTTKRKPKFDALKKCARMVKPFLSFRITSRRREGKRDEFRRQTHSFPGIKKENRGMGAMGYSSAPASIWTSPTNSGHLSASTATMYSSCPSDSTMEELQTAIQAAIAHCKNSIAMEDDKKKGLDLE